MRHSLVRLAVALALGFLPSTARAQGSGEFGSVAITARPATADVFIDGERWVSPDMTAPLVVQLPPGRHTVDVRAAGYRPFSTVIDVHRGESTPLNVILPNGPAAPGSLEQAPPPPAGPYGPSPVQQVTRTSTGDGFVFAPDFKITQLNRRTTGFAGFYGGAVFAGQVMLGGGMYFQLDDYNHNSEQMIYGGFVGEWRLFHDQTVGLTLHGLAGYGEANVGYIAAYPQYPGNPHVDPYHGGYYGYGYPYAYEGFFVGEPEAQVVARFGHSTRLVGGAGYRFTSSDFHDLNGWTASIAVQFGR
jgi:hypothetical protein